MYTFVLHIYLLLRCSHVVANHRVTSDGLSNLWNGPCVGACSIIEPNRLKRSIPQTLSHSLAKHFPKHLRKLFPKARGARATAAQRAMWPPALRISDLNYGPNIVSHVVRLCFTSCDGFGDADQSRKSCRTTSLFFHFLLFVGRSVIDRYNTMSC